MATCEDAEDLCLDMIDGAWPGVLAEVVLAAYAFVGIAVVADEHLAPGLETLCRKLNLAEDVAGASFLALGSAAPEIIISAVSTVKSIITMDDDARKKGGGDGPSEASAFATSLGVSSIIGSGMMAFTLIPGLCAMSVPQPMKLKRRPLGRDAFFYILSLSLLCVVIQDGEVSWRDAVTMVGLYVVYLSSTAAAPGIREWYRVNVAGKEPHSTDAEKGDLAESLDPETDEGDDDDEEESGPIAQALFLPFTPIKTVLSMTCPDVEEGSETEHMYPVTLVVAFTWLALFSTVLSAVITRWGMLLELPGTIMGMFIVAVGAQIPDTVQAIAVAKRGFGSMAVASAVGSQVMNILIGLGVPWLLSTSVGIPIPIVDTAQLSVMTYLMVACWVVYVAVLLLPTLPTWGRYGRASLGPQQGYILFAAYAVASVIYLFWVWVNGH